VGKRGRHAQFAWKERPPAPIATNGETLSCDSPTLGTYCLVCILETISFWSTSVTPIDFSFVFSPITSPAFEVWLAPSGHSALTLATVRSTYSVSCLGF